MAVTYKKIASVTVGSGGATAIEFTSIPATYTDLIMFLSVRLNVNDASMYMRFNGSTSGYSGRYLIGDGSSASSGSWSASAADNFVYAVRSTYTASTFTNTLIYIPNYGSSNNKSYSTDQVTENNSTTSLQILTAGLWANSAAISSIKFFYTGTANDLVQYSTATLYGISKS